MEVLELYRTLVGNSGRQVVQRQPKSKVAQASHEISLESKPIQLLSLTCRRARSLTALSYKSNFSKASVGSNWTHVSPKPDGQLHFRHFTRCHIQHRRHGFLVTRDEGVTVIEQEDIGHDKGRPFVPIEKSPVTGNAISIGGGEIRNVWSAIGF